MKLCCTVISVLELCSAAGNVLHNGLYMKFCCASGVSQWALSELCCASDNVLHSELYLKLCCAAGNVLHSELCTDCQEFVSMKVLQSSRWASVPCHITALKLHELQRHCNENPNLCVPRGGIARPQSQCPHSTLMYLWAIYIFPRFVCLFCCRKINGPILGIYKLLTDTWVWKLGLRPRN
jgi:hypothetical protein